MNNTPRKICRICNKQYDPNETIRIFGTIPAANGTCSSRCYTILSTTQQKQRKHCEECE